MNNHLCSLTAATVGLLLACDVAMAQPNPPSVSGLRNLAEVTVLKRMAESGDRNAQLALGQLFASHARPADALAWYRQAAALGSVEAALLAGEVLLYGKPASDDRQRVIAKPVEGLALVFCAATNRHPMACLTMATALQRGLGVSTNLIESYAWLRLYAEADPLPRKRELDTLGLMLSVQQLDQAEKLVRNFKLGQWPLRPDQRNYQRDSRLKLSGVAIGGRLPLAIINQRTIGEGESASLPVGGGSVIVTCLKVNENSVLIAIDQESEPRLLSLADW